MDHPFVVVVVEPILVVRKKLTRADILRFRERPFAELVKFVADVEQGILAFGGEMHVDAEAVLLDVGSDQASLWGGNYYPGRPEGACVEFSSMINLRPAQANHSMVVTDTGIQSRMRAIVFKLVGRGETWE